MSNVIASITRASSFEKRRAITEAADEQQQTIIKAAKRNAFHVDWSRILSDIGDATDPVRAIERALIAEFNRDEFADTIITLGINGTLIATLSQMEHERAAGMRRPQPVVAFKEPAPTTFKPAAAIDRWKKIIGLKDADVARLRDNLNSFQKDALPIRGRVSEAIMQRVAALHEEVIGEGLSLADFKAKARDLLPGYTDAMLEAEYRTRQAIGYGGAMHEQIVARSNAFPFIQFMALLDSATTWWICRPMGKAGPGGKGYIAASLDPIWFTWRPPLHFQCRTCLSPISYLEAQRLGILAKDGRTKIALVGSNPNRPYGDPPKFATDPIKGDIRKVEPQIGFGG